MANPIVREIRRQTRGYQPALRRRYRRAAVAIGLVESGLRELDHGDADSQNWRQERASGYADDWARTGGPLNTRASVRRVLRELQQMDRGQSVGELAADVQRPREDLRGRYAQELPRAKRILRAASQGDGGGRPSRGTAQELLATYGALPELPAGSRGVADLLGLSQRPQVMASAPAEPAFSARASLKLPGGYQAPPSTGGPGPRRSIADALQSLIQGSDSGLSPVMAGGLVTNPSQPGSTPKRGGGLQARGSYEGTAGLAQPARRIGKRNGLSVTSAKRSTERTATGGVSDHFVGKKNAYAYDLGDGQGENAAKLRAARQIARRYGVRFRKDSYNSGGTVKVNGRRFRVQILYGAGVDHADHVHVGFEAL